jgi:hypothetical protein
MITIQLVRYASDRFFPPQDSSTASMSAVSLRPSFYSPSGMVPVSAWIMVVVILLPLAALSGMIYCAAMVFVPLVKLRWIGAVGLGWALGLLATKVCRWGKVRSKLFTILSTALALLIAYYAAWGVHRTLYAAAQFGADARLGQLFLQGFLPGEIAKWMSQLVRGGGVVGIAGAPLIGIWLVELGMIAYFTRATFVTMWDDRPFCEQCDNWNAEPQPLVNLPVSPTDPAWNQVIEGGPDAVRKLRLKEDASEMVVLSLSSCPQCDRSNYLSASGGGWESNAKGEATFQDIQILRHMAVTPRQIEEIKELGEMLEEAYHELSEERADSRLQIDQAKLDSGDSEIETGRT